jgi:hypothetical protein
MRIRSETIQSCGIRGYHRGDLSDAVFDSGAAGEAERFSEYCSN